MTPGMLVAIVAVVWLVVLAGLLRLVAAMERAERLMANLNAPGRTREGRRG